MAEVVFPFRFRESRGGLDFSPLEAAKRPPCPQTPWRSLGFD
jgi:hypothetical protein